MNIQGNNHHKTTAIQRIKKKSLQQPRISSVVFFLFVLIAAHGIGPLYASAETVTMEWERTNPISDIVEYKIHYRTGGTGGGILNNYTGTGLVFDGAPLDGNQVNSATAIDVGDLSQAGNFVSIGLRNVDPSETYCFVITALSNDAESRPSNEACFALAPRITSSEVLNAEVGLPYAYDVEASGRPDPFYELTNAPVGMTIDSATGLINWTPAAAGAHDVTVQVSNTYDSDTQSFTIDVRDPSLEFIIDNEDSGTTAIGTWNVSSGVNPYGINSLYSNTLSSSFAFETMRSGLQEVSLWWTQHTNRNTQVPVEIYNGAQLLDTVLVDQTQNGGTWNVLGTYSFSGQARVVIISNTTAMSACADATRFTAVNSGAPVISTLEINGTSGTSSVYTNDSGRQVSVRIVSDDDNTVNEYAILENINDPAAATFSAVPGGAATSVDFTVPFALADLDGSRTLYAWVKDNDGIVSPAAVKSNVILDRAAPSSMINVPANLSRINTLASFAGTASDSGSGVSGITVQVTDGTQYLRADDAWVATPTWFTPDHASNLYDWWHDTGSVTFQSSSSYAIRSRATDMAGNVENPVSEITFVYDDVPPNGNIAYSSSDTSHVAPGAFTISAGFNEPLGSTPLISISGAGPLAVSNVPMSGAGNSWSYTLAVPYGDRTAYLVTVLNVVDLAGNSASLTDNFTTDTIDTDGDGLRDYLADDDDDNDGWTDAFETSMGLNPLVDDRFDDLDGDGYTNIEEILAGTDIGNKGPDQPELIPVGSPSSVTPDLVTLPYVDPEGDAHLKTIWQISTDSTFMDPAQLVLNLETDTDLESVTVPDALLVPNSSAPYYWRVKFFDDQNGPSLWSEVSSFTTGATGSSAPLVSLFEVNGLSGSGTVYTSTRDVNARIVASDNNLVTGYMIQDGISSPSGTFTSISDAAAIDLAVPFTLSDTDGTHTLYAWVQDDWSLVSTPAVKTNVILDRSVPSGMLGYSQSDTSHVAQGAFNITANFNEPLSGAPNISIAGAGPLAVSNALMSGAGNNWSYVVTVPVNDRTTYQVGISNAADPAGNTASLSGNFTTDTIDTDGDGLRDYLDDNDDDNDGWTDDFETALGLNPLVDDRNGDLDGDGYTNMEEITAGTDPGNEGPRQPELIPVASPSSVTPDLATLPYVDEEGDAHVTTIWQISTDSSFADTRQLHFHLETDDFLESVEVPGLILDPDGSAPYYWRVKFLDSQNGPSLWSNASAFSTGLDPDDANGDGIPDTNVDDHTVDLDGDGNSDAFFTTYRAVHTAVGDNIIGVEVVTPGVQIDYLKAIPPASISDPYGRPTSLPIGLVNFRLSGVPVGSTAEVIIRPLNPIDNLAWYYYDLSTGWLDYSANTVSNPDGSLSITLKDGDVGDCDGVANGLIVDPFGPGGFSSSGAPAAPSLLEDVGAGGDGCFIATAAFGSPMEKQVRYLSRFRDLYLLKSPLGKRCVDFYYRHSPPLANYMRDIPLLKKAVRLLLAPIAGMALMTVQFGGLPLMLMLACFSLFIVLVAPFGFRMRNKRNAIKRFRECHEPFQC